MMNIFQSLILLVAGLSVGVLSLEKKALSQFRRMILCVMPDSWPVFDYADYGCYCGQGGSGTPVDDLDRCCQVHDECYGKALEHHDCTPITDNPYTEVYDFSCDEQNKTVTCGPNNDECEQFICECDRKAVECFAKSPWNSEHEHLPSDQCENTTIPTVSSSGSSLCSFIDIIVNVLSYL